MGSLLAIPEIAGLDGGQGVVRIPPGLDVPLTPRVRRILDTAAFRRLARISQLGLVALVYPAAIHTRFEHSLGVFRLALRVVRRLAHDPRFVERVDVPDAELLILTALLHDLGHWPFCHPLEDIRLDELPTHEHFAAEFLREPELADVLRLHWGVEPQQIVHLLKHELLDDTGRLLGSILSGPIDIDKMDYLFRDSLHAGVPYGRNVDQNRLIASLSLNERGDGLAISSKGKTAAEMMVFARYVMFSEVYWHHAVRCATAMLQRAIFLLRNRLDWKHLLRLDEPALIAHLREAAHGYAAAELLDGLFGERRRLFKRIAQYSFLDHRELHSLLARRPYQWLVACAEEFAEQASGLLGEPVAGHEILLDAPPVSREVEFRVTVCTAAASGSRPLNEVSPVVQTLAREQFDDYVKQVRLFAHPRIAGAVREIPDLPVLLGRCAEATKVPR